MLSIKFSFPHEHRSLLFRIKNFFFPLKQSLIVFPFAQPPINVLHIRYLNLHNSWDNKIEFPSVSVSELNDLIHGFESFQLHLTAQLSHVKLNILALLKELDAFQNSYEKLKLSLFSLEVTLLQYLLHRCNICRVSFRMVDFYVLFRLGIEFRLELF